MMEETRKFNILGNKKLVLGSASPRRRELIAGLGLEVRLLEPIEVDESFPARMRPEDVPVYVSQKKAHPYQALLGSDDILLTADTVVINRGEVVGKPHDRREALAM
ncbi:MAG: Maf family protein, partial [Muribaculaceae bacterium]|nr:Maf family protein [Muribaculaceae bacterium]